MKFGDKAIYTKTGETVTIEAPAHGDNLRVTRASGEVDVLHARDLVEVESLPEASKTGVTSNVFTITAGTVSPSLPPALGYDPRDSFTMQANSAQLLLNDDGTPNPFAGGTVLQASITDEQAANIAATDPVAQAYAIMRMRRQE